MRRETPLKFTAHTNGFGIVMGCRVGGRPRHVIATVLYPEVGKEYDIAVSLIEVVSERR